MLSFRTREERDAYMDHRTFACVLVSPEEQDEQAQISEMRPLVQDEKDIIIEREIARKPNRAGYQTLKSRMQPGDTLIIKSLDRLGDDINQIRDEWKDLKEMGIRVRVIDMPLLNTAESSIDGLSMDKASELVLEVLDSAAKSSVRNSSRKQRERMENAKRRGTKLGRPEIRPDNCEEVITRELKGEIPWTEAMRILGMKKTTYYKRRGEIKEARERSVFHPIRL